ncbi:hypothetical protein NDN08_001955 [Rhodosorus marinus]|uniref:AB hydrolase-1 domain-containing protein n=1 Tax=Rhodosorus marinus TaxID=101924 RepID=A0AAV8USE8_9RHOD|nr:hypothetical protein NDN08_001955 [Rhodosorus marinus]
MGLPDYRALVVRVERVEAPSRCPLVVFFAGMDARALPVNQVRCAGEGVSIASIYHGPRDKSGWPTLRSAARAALRNLKNELQPSQVIVIAESLGAVFALSALVVEPLLVDRLVLVNSATAFRSSSLVGAGAALLPVLRIDSSGKLLYPLAATVLWRFLTSPDRVDPENITPGPVMQLPSVNVSSAPLEAAEHRLRLIRRPPFRDREITNKITMPTLIVASGKDMIFDSTREASRLADLIPDSSVQELPSCGHACLLETNVDIFRILRANDFL